MRDEVAIRLSAGASAFAKRLKREELRLNLSLEIVLAGGVGSIDEDIATSHFPGSLVFGFRHTPNTLFLNRWNNRGSTHLEVRTKK
jgi:hypothetical protein